MKFIKAEKAVTKVTVEMTLDEATIIRRKLLEARGYEYHSEDEARLRRIVGDLGILIEQARRA